jgi:hypothetical protein
VCIHFDRASNDGKVYRRDTADEFYYLSLVRMLVALFLWTRYLRLFHKNNWRKLDPGMRVATIPSESEQSSHLTRNCCLPGCMIQLQGNHTFTLMGCLRFN